MRPGSARKLCDTHRMVRMSVNICTTPFSQKVGSPKYACETTNTTEFGIVKSIVPKKRHVSNKTSQVMSRTDLHNESNSSRDTGIKMPNRTSVKKISKTKSHQRESGSLKYLLLKKLLNFCSRTHLNIHPLNDAAPHLRWNSDVMEWKVELYEVGYVVCPNIVYV